MLLSYGWRWKKEVSAKYTLNQLFIYCYSYFARRQIPESLPAFFIAQKQGKEKGYGDKIGIITCVCVYVRTKECWVINYTSKTK